jgi:predicted nuclease of predicted toxin-antitoxin system
LRLLLDEMYPTALAEALRAAGIDARTVVELGLAGRSDPEILAAAVADGYVVLTENVADFAHISAEHLTAGRHHSGVLIALSSRFSRRRAGIGAIVAAVHAVADQKLEDRVVYIQKTELCRPPTP